MKRPHFWGLLFFYGVETMRKANWEASPDYERELWRQGFTAVAGVDEAGRGPLAGPVVAAAVILGEDTQLPGLRDSKQLSAARREELFLKIRREALSVGLGIVSPKEIDQLNILRASLLAMKKAVESMKKPADFLLVDGIFTIPDLVVTRPQRALKQGDARCRAIAAASIVAKVIRDGIMTVQDRLYPGYGLAGNKGYPTAEHRAAIARLGVSPIHRRTFRGVREYLE